jgi:hypothetical protein
MPLRLLLLALSLLAIVPAAAQDLGDYLTRFELGLGRGSFHLQWPAGPLDDPDSVETSAEYEGWAVSAGWNIPLVPITPDLGVSLVASGRVILSTATTTVGGPAYPDPVNPTTRSGYAPHINLPVYAMLRYGTDATWGWRRTFGAGVGTGAHFVYHSPNKEYVAPIVVGEVSVLLRRGLPGVFRLQYQAELGRSLVSPEYYDDGRTARSWSVFLLYSALFGPRMK